MFRTITVLLFIFCLTVDWTCCLRIDRCNKAIKSRRIKRVELPSDCTEGTLYWGYPEKTLEVVISKTRDTSTLCLGYVSDPYVREGWYSTSSDSGKFYLPSEAGESMCIQYTDEISLKFFGPTRRKTYMAFIPYSIERSLGVDQYKLSIRDLVMNNSKTK